MISAFLGELLFHPCALELSFYRCTNNCAYCFANTKGETERDPGLQSVDSFIRTASTRKTLEADLFNEGFPICISNNSDPFTKKNASVTETFTRLLNNFPNGILFQTKGTYGIDEVLDAIGDRRDRVFYITMTCDDDQISKTVEPGAPTLRERIELAKTLSSAGFPVTIGFNPYVERWMPLDRLLDVCRELRDAGVIDYFFQPLFLTGRRFRELPVTRQNRFAGFGTGEDVIEYCKDDDRWWETIAAVLTVWNEVEDSNPSMTQTMNSTPYDLYDEVFSKRMPLTSEFTDWALDNEKDVYTFDDFWSVISSNNREFLERPHNGLDRYIIASARDIWRGHPENQNLTSYRKLLRVMWNHPHKFVCVPGGCFSFTFAGKDENGNLLLALTDEPQFTKEVP